VFPPSRGRRVSDVLAVVSASALLTSAGPLKGTLASLSRPQGQASSSTLALCSGPSLRAASGAHCRVR